MLGTGANENEKMRKYSALISIGGKVGRESVSGCLGFREGNGKCGKYCQQILLVFP